jgi:hypothetical protein
MVVMMIQKIELRRRGGMVYNKHISHALCFGRNSIMKDANADLQTDTHRPWLTVEVQRALLMDVAAI